MRPPPVTWAGPLLAVVVLCLCPIAATAQPNPDQPKPVVITIRPAAEPVPALSIALMPARLSLEPGNAAVYYHRAIEMLVQNREGWQSQPRKPLAPDERPPDSPEVLIGNWASGPLHEIPRDEARQKLESYDRIFHEVELGARQATCNWELDRRTEGFQLVIPEIQEMRSLSRLVTLRIRLAILDGKTDEALHWMQVGFVMGHHVGQGSMIIQALVGVAISQVTARTAEDLIQSPGAPNLYWAFTTLPRPFVDMSRAMEGERAMIDRYLPRLSDLEAAPWSTAQAQRALTEMIENLGPLVGGTVPKAGESKLGEMFTRLTAATMIARAYPEARQALLAAGRPAAEVDAMPAAQVVLIHNLKVVRIASDNMDKWTKVPYWQAAPHFNEIPSPPRSPAAANPIQSLIGMLEPATHAVMAAGTRMERQIDVIRTIEAIRLHAAAHGGKLPASLAEITEVPVPSDPATGKPFAYKVEGTTAVLSGPVPPGAHASYAFRYELKLQPSR